MALLVACAGPPQRPAPASVPAGDGLASTVITEAFVSAPVPEVEVDSLATWFSPEGETRVIASGKHAGVLLLFDGEDGRLLQELGERGGLQYPNGVATFGDWLFVVERDAARISVFELPDFVPRGQFGHGVLQVPYGLWVRESAPGEVEVFVTDSYRIDDLPNPLARLDARVKRFRVRLDEDPIHSYTLGAFGGTDEDSALRWVESIAGDPVFDRLAIAEEHPDYRNRGPLIYRFDGRYTGEHLGEGLFRGEPEGIALYECQSGNGYWITAEQGREDNRFHVFDRASLAHLGSFSGATTRFTDGIVLHPGASPRFPHGALYVANDDVGIAAFDWRDIASALNLWLDCPE
jgi:3-phytase